MNFNVYKINEADRLLVTTCTKSNRLNYLFPEGIENDCQWQYSKVSPAVYLSWGHNLSINEYKKFAEIALEKYLEKV